MKRILSAIVFVCLCAVQSFAGTIPITGTIRLANGNLLNGRVRFTLNVSVAQDTCSSNVVVSRTVEFAISNGSLPTGARIVPNDCLSPSMTTYTAQYLTTTGQVFAQNVFYIQGTSFNLGTATPTPLTTSNISFGNLTSLTDVSSAKLNNAQTCVRSGANAGVKIAAAIAALPSGGGVVDCRDLQGVQTVSQDIFSGVSKPVHLLLGVSTITWSATANVPANIMITGSGIGNTIVSAASGITPFVVTGYTAVIEGMTITGGQRAIGFATSNTDTAKITVQDCAFLLQTERVFNINSTSNSTSFLFQNNRIVNTSTSAQVLVAASGDSIEFRDNWITVGNTSAAAFDVTDGVLRVDNLLGVANSLFAWFDMHGSGSLNVTNSRLGGESGGTTDAIVINRMSTDTSYPQIPTRISLSKVDAYSTGTLLHYYGIPNETDVTGVTGLVDTAPIKIDSAVSAADLAAIGGQYSKFRVEYNSQDYSTFISGTGSPSAIAREGLPLVNAGKVVSQRPFTNDLNYQSQGSTGAYGPSASQTNVTVTTPTDNWGVTVRQFAASANAATFSLNYTTALSGIAAGVYMVVFDVSVTGGIAVQPTFVASNTTTKQWALSPGTHSVSVPFYYDGGSAQTIGLQGFNLTAGSTIQWARWKLYNGIHAVAGPRVELDGTAAPTSGQYYRGDRVYNSNRTAITGVIFWECTVSGTPGTWVATTVPTLDNSTYTPSASSLSNVDSATFQVANYSRNGDMITVSGIVAIDITSTASAFSFQATLPIALGGNFATRTQAAGSLNNSEVAGYSGNIQAVDGSNKVYFIATPPATAGTSSRDFTFIFMYYKVNFIFLWWLPRKRKLWFREVVREG